MCYKYKQKASHRPPAEYEDAPGQLDGLDPLGPVVQVQVQGADQQLVQVHLTLNVRFYLESSRAFQSTCMQSKKIMSASICHLGEGLDGGGPRHEVPHRPQRGRPQIPAGGGQRQPQAHHHLVIIIIIVVNIITILTSRILSPSSLSGSVAGWCCSSRTSASM